MKKEKGPAAGNIFSTSEQFREGTELMLNELIHNGTSHVLADLREMILIGLEDQKWLESKASPIRSTKKNCRYSSSIPGKKRLNG